MAVSKSHEEAGQEHAICGQLRAVSPGFDGLCESRRARAAPVKFLR